jgi:hypothetical protein
MLAGDGEMNSGNIRGIPGIPGRLDKVLLQRGPISARTGVKLQKGLGKAAVVQPLLRQDEPEDRRILPVPQQGFEIPSRCGDALPQIGEKGVPSQVACKGGPRLPVGETFRIEAAIPLPEHPARRPGGGGEFHQPERPAGLFVGRKQGRMPRFGNHDDPIAHPAGPVQADRRDTPPEDRKLSLHLPDAQPVRGDLFAVLRGPFAHGHGCPLPPINVFQQPA